jgi:hypothetical protein
MGIKYMDPVSQKPKISAEKKGVNFGGFGVLQKKTKSFNSAPSDRFFFPN